MILFLPLLTGGFSLVQQLQRFGSSFAALSFSGFPMPLFVALYGLQGNRAVRVPTGLRRQPLGASAYVLSIVGTFLVSAPQQPG